MNNDDMLDSPFHHTSLGTYLKKGRKLPKGWEYDQEELKSEDVFLGCAIIDPIKDGELLGGGKYWECVKVPENYDPETNPVGFLGIPKK